MKKLILLISMILFLSGCSIEYNITIDSGIDENIKINEYIDSNETAFIDVQGSSESNEKIEGIKYYDLQNYGNITEYKYKFDFSNFSRSRAANTCLSSVKLSNIQGRYILNTSGHYTCMDYYTNIEDIKVNITISDKYVIDSHNADLANGNTLSWYINKGNYTDKYIQVIFKNKVIEGEVKDPIKKEDPFWEEEPEETKSLWWLALLAILGFIGVIVFLFYYKIKNSQRG